MGILRLKKYQVFLISIIALAFFLRFYELTQNPPGFDWDEASSIYNGYSIAKTGKDEYKEPYPILFRAYDAYVPPVLIYLDAVSVTVFGLNGFAARFPNAILGTASILGLYLLVYVMTENRKFALLSALFLSLSPWHVTYSRVGTFAPLPIVFIIFGTYFFIRGLTRKWFLLLATLSFMIATLSYFAAYVFVPLFILALILLYRKNLIIWQAVIIFISILSVVAIPFVLPGGQMRLRGISVLSDPDLIKKDTLYASQEWGGKLLHNRRLVFGLLYWWELPILLFGIYQLLRNRPNGWLIVILWLLLAPLPSAPTFPKPASTRSILLVPAFSVLIAYGFWYLSTKSSKLIVLMLAILFSVNVLLFMHQYFTHFPKEKAVEWFSAYKPLFAYLNQTENSSKKVIFWIFQPDYLDQVHMFTAFYNQIDPQIYQNYGGTRTGRFGTAGEFAVERFSFIPQNCTDCGKSETYAEDDLVVTAHELPYKSVAVFPATDHPSLYVYGMEEISLQGKNPFPIQ
ncbi:MAG: Glycosyl transferase family 39 [Candidatus Gottesmanbacteria bacterium GW2011_GWA1_43_11]|uniref:Glycosyl transferase family 39 n=1 Tax=Candidatus Gottesmanbacteria bacterium GW2011_GWA1_43_11 TaxID=1618436 RepID=A0A0G1CEF3_9BACT|nr:MAG: Glycosyl transferase family 39 [Candidatus Gottesmanbacteria bacterium GW2011_GWA1_43_11]